MALKFTKMHGIGNDYIYFDCTKTNPVANPEKLSENISRYHFGVGSDGIVLILPSEKADFRMRMFNADGSEGKMCGNATRCIGKYVYERGLTDKKTITLETLSGIKTLELNVIDGKVKEISVDMGSPVFETDKIPVISSEKEFIAKTINVCGKDFTATCVSMGNPHCVIFTENTDSLNLEKIGPDFENHKIFPERVNTEFVEILNDNILKMRVWERGSGETLACGTGACAVTAAAVKNGICKTGIPVTIRLKGGELKILYREDGNIIMTGPASFVFDGELLIDDIE